MSDSFDVVIIGSGHNGLTAGTYLGKAGKRVLILEQAGRAGGMSTGDTVIPEAPNHMINMGAVELIHLRTSPVLTELELARHGYRTLDTDPSYAYLDPDGGSIAVFRDVRRTADDIARFSKADAASYLKFMELIGALMEIAAPMLKGDPTKPTPAKVASFVGATVRNRRLRRELTELTSGTADQLCSEWFEHPATQALMLAVVIGAGPFDIDGNAVAYLLFGLMHFVGVGKPIGGMRMLANALQSAYAASGGTLELNAEVEEILVSGGRTTGVRLKGGRVIATDTVIATCDPRTAFGMTTPGAVDRKILARVAHVPANRSNIGPALLNVALDRPLRLRRHQELRTDDADLNKAVGLIGTADELRQNVVDGRRAKASMNPIFSLSPASNWDQSQAPEGQSTAYIYMPASPVEVEGGWDAQRTPYCDAIIAKAGQYYDGFEGEIGRWFETCPDRAKRLNVTNGCVTHVDFGSYRSGTKRPAVGLAGADPVVPGLYIGGAGGHPGGGVSGLPGRLAAHRVIDEQARVAEVQRKAARREKWHGTQAAE